MPEQFLVTAQWCNVGRCLGMSKWQGGCRFRMVIQTFELYLYNFSCARFRQVARWNLLKCNNKEVVPMDTCWTHGPRMQTRAIVCGWTDWNEDDSGEMWHWSVVGSWSCLRTLVLFHADKFEDFRNKNSKSGSMRITTYGFVDVSGWTNQRWSWQPIATSEQQKRVTITIIRLWTPVGPAGWTNNDTSPNKSTYFLGNR